MLLALAACVLLLYPRATAPQRADVPTGAAVHAPHVPMSLRAPGPTVALRGAGENASADAPGQALTVRVVDRRGVPLAGRRVELFAAPPHGNDAPRAVETTGPLGRARFPALTPADVVGARVGSWQAHEFFTLLPTSPFYIRWAPLTGWHTELHCDMGVEMDVTFWDAARGTRLPYIAWALREDRNKSRRRVGRRTVGIVPGTTVHLALQLDVPEGYAAWQDPEPEFTIPDDIRSLKLHYPLYPLLPVVVHLVDERGHALGEDAAVQCALVPHADRLAGGGDATEALAERDTLLVGAQAAKGRARFEIPRVVGEPLRIAAITRSTRRTRRAGVWRGFVPRADVARLVVELPLVEDSADGFLFQFSDDMGLTENSFASPGPAAPTPAATGTLAVQCARHDGSPAAGVQVTARGPLWRQRQDDEVVEARYECQAHTDAEGRAQWEDIAAGTWDIMYTAHLRATARVTVHPGRSETLRMKEPRGGTLELHVVDATGRSIAFATLSTRHETSQGNWRPAPEGTHLRVDRTCGPHGRRTLRRLHPGTHTVYAQRGAHTGQARVQITDSATSALTLVLRIRSGSR